MTFQFQITIKVLNVLAWRVALVLVLSWATMFVDRTARAQSPISLELVLAVDTSLSVDDKEFDLQMSGIAEAFRSPEVVEIISLQDGVAVKLIQWAGWASEKDTVPWRLLTDRASIIAFADEIEAVAREFVGNQTAIGSAVNAAMDALDANAYHGKRRKIDISGDGISNSGPPSAYGRALAIARNVTINGLAVQTDVPELANYFRRFVISGPGAFVIEAADYNDFARAIHLKLVRELAPEISREKGPAMDRQAAHLNETEFRKVSTSKHRRPL